MMAFRPLVLAQSKFRGKNVAKRGRKQTLACGTAWRGGRQGRLHHKGTKNTKLFVFSL